MPRLSTVVAGNAICLLALLPSMLPEALPGLWKHAVNMASDEPCGRECGCESNTVDLGTFENFTAVITGGCGSIGYASAKRLVKHMAPSNSVMYLLCRPGSPSFLRAASELPSETKKTV